MGSMANDNNLNLTISTTPAPFKSYHDNVVKSPLLIMIPQELKTPDLEGHLCRTDTWEKAALTNEGILFHPPSFSLQNYLNYDNGLERRMTGVPDGGSTSSSTNATALAQPETTAPTEGQDPLGEMASQFPAAIEVDQHELYSESLDNSALYRSSVAQVPAATESPHHTSEQSPTSPNSSSPASSHLSILNCQSTLQQQSRRYASLHRQLLEAGLSGLSDGSNSMLLYHRYVTVCLSVGHICL